MLKNYFKTAWKNIFRNKVFAIINIGGLSVGIGCCMLILLYTADELWMIISFLFSLFLLQLGIHIRRS